MAREVQAGAGLGLGQVADDGDAPTAFIRPQAGDGVVVLPVMEDHMFQSAGEVGLFFGFTGFGHDGWLVPYILTALLGYPILN